ncbi:MAG TPA: putative zinc-binding metallopeptidase [Polyangiaceae bacterium]|nr:putative zinc-binding metallopeptidase [Polyangiaceae bacterium]
MQTFECVCGERIFFENTRCLSCSRELGFELSTRSMLALDPSGTSMYEIGHNMFRKCKNYAAEEVCNWLVPTTSEQELCEACRLNNVVPDLSVPENHARWGEMERAKRRLVYTLSTLNLPLVPKSEDSEHGLAFDIKADTPGERVLTGHADGLITLNLAEADPAVRERVRADMNERYRTLLGHFRHESGHYFWERLIRDQDRVQDFRDLFGDETRDYGESIAAYYASPAPVRNDEYISAYASSHPWEDWAETFAHYLHMIDTLETAQCFGLAQQLAARSRVPNVADFGLLINEWTDLTVALNALNRSMGLPDAYPFAISARVREKLEFVHHIVRGERARPPISATSNARPVSDIAPREPLVAACAAELS